MEHRAGLAGQFLAAEPRFAALPWRALAASPEWDALAHYAAEPNPFAERWCLAPALAAFDPRGHALLGHCTAGDVTLGVMPVTRRSSYAGRPLPHLAGWLHPNAFCAAPLVAAGHEQGFWQALFEWADDHAGSALFLHLPCLPHDGPLFAALRAVCVSGARPAAVVHRLDRALLRSAATPQAYFEASLSAKKRKELRRQHARLSELGALCVERLDDAAALDTWIAEFLALEAAGWKGREGSALACDPATTCFFAEALAGAAAAGRLERLALRLDGRAIAMLVNFITPPGAYSFKTAYDEAFARYSPSVLLQCENLALLARDGVQWADSCAAPDHPMIERIWREKRTMVRVSVAIGGRTRRAAAALLFRAETGARLEGL